MNKNQSCFNTIFCWFLFKHLSHTPLKERNFLRHPSSLNTQCTQLMYYIVIVPLFVCLLWLCSVSFVLRSLKYKVVLYVVISVALGMLPRISFAAPFRVATIFLLFLSLRRFICAFRILIAIKTALQCDFPSFHCALLETFPFLIHLWAL